MLQSIELDAVIQKGRYDLLPLVSMVRQSRTQPPPRPHSADFLEYEAARRPQQQPAQCERPPDQQRRPQRPKSSLDIVNPSDATNDGYFYSEERYAHVNLSFMFHCVIFCAKRKKKLCEKHKYCMARLYLDTRRRCGSLRFIYIKHPSIINNSGISLSRALRCSRNYRVSATRPTRVEYPYYLIPSVPL